MNIENILRKKKENILRDSSCCNTLVEKHLESTLKWLLHTHSNFDQMGEVFVQGKTDQTGDDQRSGNSTDSQGNNRYPNTKPQKVIQIDGQVV